MVFIRVVHLLSRLCGCFCPCGLSFFLCNILNSLCPCFFPRRNEGSCCLPGSGNKVYPSSDDEHLEDVSDFSTFFALQQFLDGAFRDRAYTGQYKPKFLTVHEAYRVRNSNAQEDYAAVREKLQNARSPCDSFGDPVLTGRELPVALQRDLENWGLDVPLDALIHEHLFFHGTHQDAAKGIVAGDFRLPDTHQHGGSYGRGVYLAEACTKAHMYCKPRNGDNLFPLLIVRSALGKVSNTAVDVPNADALNTGAANGTWDSVCGDRRKLVNNFSGYREFIVYDSGQVLALYLLWVSERKPTCCCCQRSCRI